MFTTVLAAVLSQLLQFQCWFFGKGTCYPYLAVRVRVRASHGGAFVLKNLHIAVLFRWLWKQRGRGDMRRFRCRSNGHERRGRCEMRCINLGPDMNDGSNLGWRQVCKREIMARRECQDIAYPRDGLCLEKYGFQACGNI